MSIPCSREEFIDYIKRRLGDGVIQINVSDEQVEDRIDFALTKFRDYHYDGTSKTFYKHALTAQDITNQYLTLPRNVTGITGIFDLSGLSGGTDILFNVQYQIVMNDIWTWQNSSLVPYYMTMQHLTLIEQILTGMQPERYNVYDRKLKIDTDWARFSPGTYIVVECWILEDPEVNTKIWSDWWLIEYATAQVKQQWGEHLKKYPGMQMPGNLAFSGQAIFDEATADIARLEEKLYSLQEPPLFFVG